MTNRELAWRVFAGEYNHTTLQLEPSQEREPGYLVTPLGAKINRIFVVGVLTDIEKLERNGNTHYRARVSDRTGVFYIYAGQYDPKVIKILSDLEPPAYIAVIGKSRMYSPEEGVTYVSIRPENIVVVDKNARDYWLLDTCKSIKTRLESFIEAQQMEPPEVDKLIKLGFDSVVAQGVMESLQHYKQLDITYYRNMLVDVLKYLAMGNGEGYITTEKEYSKNLKDLTEEFKTGDELTEPEETKETVRSTNEDLEFEPTTDVINDSVELQELEDKLLEVIRLFKGKKYKDGVPWHELMVKATDDGIDKNLIEELVNNLLEKGKIYEPILGRIKCTN